MVASLITTTLAGIVASVTESTATYPLEYLKTRQQLAVRPLQLVASGQLPQFSIPKITSVLYQGWSPFVVGNLLKTWIRFNTFNAATKFMSTDSRTGQTTGRATAPVVIASGVATGIAETLVVVPFESIKTTMIEASSLGTGAATGAMLPLGAPNTRLNQPSAPEPAIQPAPQSNAIKQVRPIRPVRPASDPTLVPISTPQGMIRTLRDMYRHRGLRAFVQGANPTVFRQVANSAVRFTAWNSWMQLVALDGENNMSWFNVLVGSGVASAVESVATQPLDVVKSRMQTANGVKLYGNSLVCAYRIFAEEGWQQLWAGLAPRWVRKWVSGGILWAMYELSTKQIDRMMREMPFN